MAAIEQRVIESQRVDWINGLDQDPSDFERGLLDLGLDHDVIETDVGEYQHLAELLDLQPMPTTMTFTHWNNWNSDESDRRGAWQAFRQGLRDLIARREYRIEDSAIQEVKVPVFWLTCPDTKRSKVQYKEEVMDENNAALAMTVWGTGMGAKQSVGIAYASELEAMTGERKLIFVRYPLRISLVGIYEHGSLVRKSLRSEVPEDRQKEFRLGIEICTAAESAMARRDLATNDDEFLLADDTSKAVHTFARIETESTTFAFHAGMTAFGLALSSKTQVSRKTKITMTFHLRSGFNYEIKLAKNGTGVWWV